MTITSTGASGSPIDIPVTLNVTAPQTFTVTRRRSASSTCSGPRAPAPKTVQLTASVADRVTFTAAATTSGGGTWLDGFAGQRVRPAR